MLISWLYLTERFVHPAIEVKKLKPESSMKYVFR